MATDHIINFTILADSYLKLKNARTAIQQAWIPHGLFGNKSIQQFHPLPTYSIVAFTSTITQLLYIDTDNVDIITTMKQSC